MNRKYCILCKKQGTLNKDGVCRPCLDLYNTAQLNSSPSEPVDLTPSEQRIVNALSAKMDTWKLEVLAEMRSKDEKIEDLSKEVEPLKTTVAKLEEQVDNNEAYERRDCLVFSGSSIPPYRTGENSIDAACDLIKSKINLEISKSDISIGHRIGQKPASQGEDKRPIILKFCRREVKTDILNSCKQVRPQNFYANESLTPIRSKILYVLRQAKRRHPEKIASCNTIDGKIVVWVKPPRPEAQGARNSKIFINSKSHLEKFLRDLLELSLQDIYDGDWPN